jgi:hypothetical protein
VLVEQIERLRVGEGSPVYKESTESVSVYRGRRSGDVPTDYFDQSQAKQFAEPTEVTSMAMGASAEVARTWIFVVQASRAANRSRLSPLSARRASTAVLSGLTIAGIGLRGIKLASRSPRIVPVEKIVDQCCRAQHQRKQRTPTAELRKDGLRFRSARVQAKSALDWE